MARPRRLVKLEVQLIYMIGDLGVDSGLSKVACKVADRTDSTMTGSLTFPAPMLDVRATQTAKTLRVVPWMDQTGDGEFDPRVALRRAILAFGARTLGGLVPPSVGRGTQRPGRLRSRPRRSGQTSRTRKLDQPPRATPTCDRAVLPFRARPRVGRRGPRVPTPAPPGPAAGAVPDADHAPRGAPRVGVRGKDAADDGLLLRRRAPSPSRTSTNWGSMADRSSAISSDEACTRRSPSRRPAGPGPRPPRPTGSAFRPASGPARFVGR